MINLKFVKTRPVKTPMRATQGSACYDFYVPDDFQPAKLVKTLTIPTGLRFEIPHGWVMLINSRSGMGFKHQVRLSNCQGVIDSDYRDEVMIQLINDNIGSDVAINPGDRIAQFWLQPVHEVELSEVSALDNTQNRGGGFGSTGA